MNTIGYFEIQATDPEKLVEFYKNAFGWQFERDVNIPIQYWRLTSPGMMGAILQRPAQIPPMGHGTNAYVCSIQIESFDKTAEKILSNGGIVAMDKFAIPGKCWQGYFLDSDHNTFGIFEVDPGAK